jgi:glycosyltransferase involved in cell wall biosynthesis/SAM-dependent methyltransferase
MATHATGAFTAFRGRHPGAPILVCGCGRSLTELTDPARFLTIGVNDVGRLFDPTYLVVVNPRSQFRDDRFRYVEESGARALFTQLDLGRVRPPVVRFRLGRYGGTELGEGDTLHYTQNSPYVAVCLAGYIGATRIGLIGVDLTDHHFFGRTGRHSLTGRLRDIDQQYGRLAAALAARGVELVNVSPISHLTSLPRAELGSFAEAQGAGTGEGEAGAAERIAVPAIGPAQDDDPSAAAARPAASPAGLSGGARSDPVPPPRVFFVHYRFLSCGDVFRTGLENAARDLGLEWAGADCDEPGLPALVERFRPDLLFVVHGRTFRDRWGRRITAPHRAVWLLDEPYEVDDTEVTSRFFDTVFVNDASTLGRHRNASYLPVAWDPHVHRPGQEDDRPHAVGFIGGGNRTREAMLLRLAREGLLSYLVGGSWRARELRALCLGANVPASRTAELYRETRLVINVFRDRHHFNRHAVPATSLNPRVYEALGCGALVVSEERPEVSTAFPELPTFRTADELAETVRALLADAPRRAALLASCRARLSPHTYAERLRAVLAAALPEHPWHPANPDIRAVNADLHVPTPDIPAATDGIGAASAGSADPTRDTDANALAMALDEISDAPAGASHDDESAPAGVPGTSILMVVHGGLEMTRLAVLRTLRHTAAADARLVVVDNASTDGTREWLRLMARRGDLDLLESPTNEGHGPGLERARRHTRSPYLVTLDSDAFPLADDWLARLRARLDGGAAVAGILHHREYVHPSCLMIARRTLDELGLSFLDEKDRPSRLDVAERISVELRRRGARLAGLRRTGALRRGSVSEPVYLGSAYEGIVFHQWYSTRAAGSAGGPVDDVPREALDRSLAETLEDGHREPRDVTVVIGARARNGDETRRRNALAVLTALNYQDLPRHTYRIVVVEQDDEPRLAAETAPLADRHLFVHNPGAYNRAWGFNVGAALAGPGTGPVCFIDADLLVPPDFLRRGLEAWRAGARAVLPYRSVSYLAARETEAAVEERLAEPFRRSDPERFRGRRFDDSEGGALWVDAELYRAVGGHDERFRGWGCEDREICMRLEHSGAKPLRLDGTLIHLHHPRPAESDDAATANQALLDELRRTRRDRCDAPFGDPERYAAEPRSQVDRPARAPAVAPRPDRPGYRDWEHWNEWSAERIGRILAEERRLAPAASARRALADLAAGLGSEVLDLGCGPGALWPHLMRHRPRLRWVGADVTEAMVRAARAAFPTVPVVQADAGRLPWRDRAFDVVVVRHLLEHIPEPLMQRALTEAVRVARRAVVVAFYLPPSEIGISHTARVAEGFWETRWTRAEVDAAVAAAGGALRERREGSGTEDDEIWVVAPHGASLEPLAPAATRKSVPGDPLRFSIVMPTFRRGHRLPTTVMTVLSQTYPHWELIVVDNAGDCDLRVDDPRVSIHRHVDKASAAYARNQGLRHITGDLVCFFDDDDDMFPEYLERLAAAFQREPRAKMVRCGMIVGDGTVNYSYATPEVCIRREYAEPIWTGDGIYQDQNYFRRIVSRNRWNERRRDIVFVREPLCRANSDPVGGLRAGGY